MEGEAHVDWNDHFDHPRACIGRCNSDLATQQGMGLWPERSRRIDSGRAANSSVAGPYLTAFAVRANRSLDQARTPPILADRDRHQ